jgi:hypothetical protein
MVEGDLMDMTLPTLLQALSRENATAQLRVQNGTVHGALHLREGALIHATGVATTGDAALLELLGWTAGRFRIVRDTEDRPCTITPRLTALVTGGAKPARALPGTNDGGPTTDARLLHDALALLTQLDLDSIKVKETLSDASGISALMILTGIINSLVGYVMAQTSEPDVFPSRVLHRLGSTNPHVEVITEVDERVSIDTVVEVLRTWDGAPARQRQFFSGTCEALMVVLDVYGRTVGTFFRGARERQEWRATFDVFVDGLRRALAIADRDQDMTT